MSFRVITADSVRIALVGEFMRELERWRRDGFADAPSGPLTIEALDREGRLCWRAYYTNFQLLADELASDR